MYDDKVVAGSLPGSIIEIFANRHAADWQAVTKDMIA